MRDRKVIFLRITTHDDVPFFSMTHLYFRNPSWHRFYCGIANAHELNKPMTRLRDLNSCRQTGQKQGGTGDRRKRRKKKITRRLIFYNPINAVVKEVDSVGSCGVNLIVSYCCARQKLLKVGGDRKTVGTRRSSRCFPEFESTTATATWSTSKSITSSFFKISYDVIQPLNVCTGVLEGILRTRTIHFEPKHTSTGNIVQDNKGYDVRDSRKQKPFKSKINYLFAQQIFADGGVVEKTWSPG